MVFVGGFEVAESFEICGFCGGWQVWYDVGLCVKSVYLLKKSERIGNL